MEEITRIVGQIRAHRPEVGIWIRAAVGRERRVVAKVEPLPGPAHAEIELLGAARSGAWFWFDQVSLLDGS